MGFKKGSKQMELWTNVRNNLSSCITLLSIVRTLANGYYLHKDGAYYNLLDIATRRLSEYLTVLDSIVERGFHESTNTQDDPKSS